MTLIGMIIHGHGDETFSQYSNELWPNDPNFTLSCLCACFVALKKSQLRIHRFCLSLNPKRILPTNFARKFMLLECIEPCG